MADNTGSGITAASPSPPKSPPKSPPPESPSKSPSKSPPKSPNSPPGSNPEATEHPLEAEEPIDAVAVDEDLEDNDSAFGDQLSSYTSSLASSVLNYPVEHGRRYHAYQSGRYSRPNDEAEMERLLLLHTIMTGVTGHLFLAPVEPEKLNRVLDIGTGTGIWALTIGDEFENATVIGNDLSANMPTFVPPNVKFEVDDVEAPWLATEKYSWIFCRYMAASILDWPKLVENIYENLEPGGWAEFQDFDLQYYSEDGSLKPEDPLLYWISTLLDAARKLNREPNPGSKLEDWVKQQPGFTNIVHKKYRVPIGPWARDPLLKEIGSYNHKQVMDGLEGLSLRLYTNVLGWKPEEVLVLLAKVRQDLRNPNIHAMFDFHVVYAQKTE